MQERIMLTLTRIFFFCVCVCRCRREEPRERVLHLQATGRVYALVQCEREKAKRLFDRAAAPVQGAARARRDCLWPARDHRSGTEEEERQIAHEGAHEL